MEKVLRVPVGSVRAQPVAGVPGRCRAHHHGGFGSGCPVPAWRHVKPSRKAGGGVRVGEGQRYGRVFFKDLEPAMVVPCGAHPGRGGPALRSKERLRAGAA